MQGCSQDLTGAGKGGGLVAIISVIRSGWVGWGVWGGGGARCL